MTRSTRTARLAGTPTISVTLLALASLLLLQPSLSARVNGAATATSIHSGADVDHDRPSEWHQWRGPNRDGSVAGAPWPRDLTSVELLWRVELGKGYPGPIVSSDTVFVVETVDSDTEQVRALSRRTGEELWRTAWKGGMDVPFFARRNGNWVRSTPAFDGEALYVGGMQERFFKLDAASGDELWSVDFAKEFGTAAPDFGFSSSPLVDSSSIYVQAANSVIKLDKETGEVIWRALASLGSMFDSGAFSSPVVAEIRGTRQLVAQTRTTLYGLDLDSGNVLWQHDVPSFRGMNILTPMIVGDSVLTSTHRNNTFFFDIEAESAEGEGHAEALTATESWRHKAHGYMSSPIVVDGHAYLKLGNRRMICIDLSTGTETWTSEPISEYFSMVAQGDLILALGAEGELHLIEANPSRFERLDRREVSEQETWGYLAVAGDELFVRELEGVAAYRWSSGESPR